MMETEVMENEQVVQETQDAPLTDAPVGGDAAQEVPATPRSAPDKVQRRINQLVAERGRAQGQLDAALARIAELEARQQPREVTPDAAPNPADFKDFETFLDARARHIASKTFEEGLARQSMHWQAVQEQRAQQSMLNAWNERLAKARVEIPDLEEAVMSADVPISPAATRAIMASEAGPAVLYHLAKNPADTHKLNTLSPEAAFLFVGRIETKIEAAQKAQTNTPKPLTPVSGTGNSSAAPSEHDDMDAWVKKRNKQLGRR